MASNVCWRCRLRPASALLLSSLPICTTRAKLSAAPFSASSILFREKSPSKRAAKGSKTATQRGDKKTFSRKNKPNLSKSKPPPIGARKAFRKRIILSNTNALEVSKDEYKEMEAGRILEDVGQIVRLPGPVIDQLRASEAFRPTQSWGLFRSPSMLVRKETKELVEEIEIVEQAWQTKDGQKEVFRHIFTGERGSGKSVLLLQAMATAFEKNWVVISIPEAQFLLEGSSEYAPMPQTKPTRYYQKTYTSKLLEKIIEANPVLSELKITQEHNLPVSIQANASLSHLSGLGSYDPEIALPVFNALMTELKASGRPPLLFALDGMGHAMMNSHYKNPSFEPIHAHDFHLVQWFMSHLSGQDSLSNGGMVIAAISKSQDPKNRTLDLRLQQMHIKQALEADLKNPAHNAALPDPMLPFLVATGQQPNPIPLPDPFYRYDQRVFEVLGGPFGIVPVDAGNAEAVESRVQDIQIKHLHGLNKEEARTLMEYWAKSGMMRQEVSERLVGEKWSISGGGIIGELERGCVRFRV